MTRMLVTGATGFVGQALLAHAVSAGGFQLRGALRRKATLPLGVEPVIVSDLGPGTDWRQAVGGMDVVVHLAARVHVMRESAADPLAEFRKSNVEGTLALARAAAAAGVRRFVFVSSIKVNGEETHGGERYSVDDAAAPQDPYGISKWEAEQALYKVADATGIEVVVVRPPLVYGPGVKGNFAQMLEAVRRRTPLPLASVKNRRSMIYVENLADALLSCATHPAACDQTYLVCDGEDISTPDLIRQLAAGMGVAPSLFPCPLSLLRLAGRVAGKSRQLDRLLGSLRIDGGRIRADLNWTPPYSLRQGLEATAQWYREQYK